MPGLPEGTVSFLFTDIEGSTRRWEADREGMGKVVALHDRLLGAVVAEHAGHVFKTGGDAVYAVFATAPDAIAAALDGQRRLAGTDWGGPGPIRVRMAIHSGEAELRDGDYFGPPLNRVARILGAAAGGQVLVSGTAAALARDQLPEGAALQDLGSHRFRDLASPEQVFQLVHPELEKSFPPLKSLGSHPNNLPIQVTSFVGRESELARVVDLLGAGRLVTLTGAGGSGKTRLAVQAAAELQEQFPDGAWFADLAPLTQPELVPRAVASAMSLREEPGRPLLDALLAALASARALIVLDNCEHLVDAAASLADALLRSCPKLAILATSREALGIAGETAWRVPPLGVPDPDLLPPLAELGRHAAIELFVDRARAARPDFHLTRENAAAVAQVCHRLDGIPLAIELAAVRVKALSPGQVAERLDDRFRLLTGGSRVALPRQQTLQALVDWSHDLLGDQEKALFRRLGVFAGGWTLEDAEAVCAGETVEDYEILDLLGSLVDKSLVLTDALPAGDVRYRMLETLRDYAAARLAASGEAPELRSRHLDRYLGLAESATSAIPGDTPESWIRRMTAERDNLRAALRSALELPDLERGLRLAGALRTWYWRFSIEEGRRRSEELLERAAPGEQSAGRAAALLTAGITAWGGRDFEIAKARLQESLAVYRGLGDERGATEVVTWLAVSLPMQLGAAPLEATNR